MIEHVTSIPSLPFLHALVGELREGRRRQLLRQLDDYEVAARFKGQGYNQRLLVQVRREEGLEVLLCP